MAKFTQEKRPVKIQTTLGADDLLLVGFTGTEAVSCPYEFTLELMSYNGSIDAKKLLRSPVAVKIALESGERVIHGAIRRFVQLGQEGDLTFYRAEIVPWLWFLSLSSECKIYQNLSVLEIVEKVFKAQGYSDFQIKCSKSYPKREYCVQYRETHLNFVSRLMEEEGIFYFFEHSSGKHMLTLADAPNSFQACPGQSKVRFVASEVSQTEDVVTAFQREHCVHPGKSTLRDHDFLQPSLRLESSLAGKEKEEGYDYPGGFTKLDDGDRLARLQVETWEAGELKVEGSGNCRAFQPGYRFELVEHYRKDMNQAYALLEISHKCAGGFQTWDEGVDYENEFVAMPHGVPFHPPRKAQKPVVHGSQTALVVGKAGEEIWTDKYGRVRVQFYWDRDGKKDENSSCWVRVASTWAGKNWGFVHIPRIGQEVIVDFLEGDPDQPIITGRVYNAEQMPPYELPANQTQSGVKSRSSKGGSTPNFNEFRFEDKKDAEEVYLHAEKDCNVVIENDRTTTIEHNDKKALNEGNESLTIKKGDQLIKLEEGKQETKLAKGDHLTTLEDGKFSLSVKKGDHQTVVKGKQILEVEKDQTITLNQGNQSTTLKMGNQELMIKMGNQKVTLDMGNMTNTVKLGNIESKANLGKQTQEAMMGIELKVGQSSIKVDQTGVTIKGMMVTIEGQVMTQVKGLMTQVEASAMLQAKGAITMIG